MSNAFYLKVAVFLKETAEKSEELEKELHNITRRELITSSVIKEIQENFNLILSMQKIHDSTISTRFLVEELLKKAENNDN